MATVTWVEGDTGQRIFTLTQNGSVAVLDGATVTAIVRPANRSLPKKSLPVTVIGAGQVGCSFDETQLMASESPYTARFRVQQNGNVRYFPFPKTDLWEVVE
jgi:hypothetical protein